MQHSVFLTCNFLQKVLAKNKFEDSIETTRLILFEIYGILSYSYRIGDISAKERDYRTDEIDQFWEKL